MDDDESLQQERRGYWLKRARTRARLTLAGAAHAAGLSGTSGSSVSHWEDGSRPIKVVHLERLAAAYGVPVEFFLRPPVTDDERLDLAAGGVADLEEYRLRAQARPSRAERR